MSAPPQKGRREEEEPERVKKKVSSGDDGKESGQDTVCLNSTWVVECLVFAQRAKACVNSSSVYMGQCEICTQFT